MDCFSSLAMTEYLRFRRPDRLLRGQCPPLPAQQRLDRRAFCLRQPDQHHRIIFVVVGEVKHAWLALHQHVALVGRNARHDQTVAVLLQPHQHLLAHFQRRRAVGGAVLDLGPRQRDLSDVVEGHGSALLLILRSARLSRASRRMAAYSWFETALKKRLLTMRFAAQCTAVKNRARRKPDSQVHTGLPRMPRSHDPTAASGRPIRLSIGSSPTPPSRTETRLSAELSRLSPSTKSFPGGTVTSAVSS